MLRPGFYLETCSSWIRRHVGSLLLKYFYWLTTYSLTSLSPMATPFDTRLSPDATEPNHVNWLGLRVYMEDHFHAFPDSTVRLFSNVDSSDICPYITQHRICPSLFTDFQCSALYHPEFIVRNDEIQWLPRTWVCRAFQRSILPDGSGAANCPIDNCHYAHAGLWSTSEQLAFRALALRTHHHNLGLLYHLQPTDGGQRPPQHYTSYKHNLFSQHINGANTNTEPTFHHHPHTAANFHKSATCLPTIGQPTQMCHTDPDDPRHHGDQPHRQGLLQHGLNRLLPRCLTHHQNRHHLTNSNSSRPRDGAPAIALQHLHPGPQRRHHHRQHYLKTMCGRLLHTSTTQSHPPQPSALTTPKKRTVTAWRYQDPTYDSAVHHHQQQTLHQNQNSASNHCFRLWPTRLTITQSQLPDQTTHTTFHMFRTCSYVTLFLQHPVTSTSPPLTIPRGSCPATSYINSTTAHYNIQSNKPWHHGAYSPAWTFVMPPTDTHITNNLLQYHAQQTHPVQS